MSRSARSVHRAINLLFLLVLAVVTFRASYRSELAERVCGGSRSLKEKSLNHDSITGFGDDGLEMEVQSSPLAGDMEALSYVLQNGGDSPLRYEMDYTNETSQLEKKDSQLFFPKTFPRSPPNRNFIFHNKLPKSGSSTMNNILKVLRIKNKFNFLKVESGVTTFYDQRPLVDFLQSKVEPPYLLLKHHYWINFTEYNMKQPTFINVIRDPIEWFTSRYYFLRYGWKRKPGCRTENCGMTRQEFEMDIDECVATAHPSCVLTWMYIPFFCGATPDCIELLLSSCNGGYLTRIVKENNRYWQTITSLKEKKRSLEIAKKRIVEDYYFVGILEQFEDTLRSLEMLLPSYFEGAVEAWKGEFVQRMQDLTTTTFKKKMSKQSEEYFRNGPLKYEVELYEFARELFNRRLKSLGLKSVGSIDGRPS